MNTKIMNAELIERWARKYGYHVASHQAQTGTVYLTLTHPEAPDRKVRVADHGECYCTEDWSCDPAGLTKDQIVALLAGESGHAVPGWITRTRNRTAARLAIYEASWRKIAEANRGARERQASQMDWLRVNEPATVATWSAKQGRPGRRFRNAALLRAEQALGADA